MTASISATQGHYVTAPAAPAGFGTYAGDTTAAARLAGSYTGILAPAGVRGSYVAAARSAAPDRVARPTVTRTFTTPIALPRHA